MDYDPFSTEVRGFKQRTHSSTSVCELHKGLKDVVTFKSITNPVGYAKETIKTIKRSPVQGITMTAAPFMGQGARPAAVNQFVLSKGKDKWDSSRQLNSSLTPGYEPLPEPELPPAPVPDAPYSMRSRAVTDKMRAAKEAAGKRKGFMATLFAKETGGFGGTGNGASLLGG